MNKRFYDNDGQPLTHGDVFVNIMTGDACVLDTKFSPQPTMVNLYDCSKKPFDAELAKECKKECRISEIRNESSSLFRILKSYGKEDNCKTVCEWFVAQTKDLERRKRVSAKQPKVMSDGVER